MRDYQAYPMPAPASGKWAPSGRKRREIHAFTRENHALELILTLGVEVAVGAVIIGLGNEDLGRPVQIAVIGSGRVDKGLGGGDAVFLQHDHQHFGVDDRSGVEQFHEERVAEGPGENIQIPDCKGIGGNGQIWRNQFGGSLGKTSRNLKFGK